MANATGKLIFSDALMFLRRSRRRGTIMKKAVRGALKRQIAVWRKKTLPKHFEEFSPTIYPGAYKNRAPSTNKRKLRNPKIGHTRPMVHTGEFRKAMLAAAPQIPKKIRKRVRIKFTPFVRKGNFWGRNTFHNFPRSLTAFNRRDKRDFAVGIERSLKKIIKRELKRRGAKTVKRFTA